MRYTVQKTKLIECPSLKCPSSLHRDGYKTAVMASELGLHSDQWSLTKLAEETYVAPENRSQMDLWYERSTYAMGEVVSSLR